MRPAVLTKVKMNDNSQYLIHTFSNGLRAVVARSAGGVSYTGALVNAGSRDEEERSQGLAHFVEHTVFKGTRHRRSCHISSRMESIGGELNAYTTKEETMVYTNAPAGYVERSLELLSDLVRNSIFPEREIEKEKEVIIEEILSYRDSPSDSVYDEFEELIYRDSGLAHNILGTPESVKALTGQDARRFIETCYTPGRLAIYCVDPGDPERNLRIIERYFGDMDFADTPSRRTPPSVADPFNETRRRDTHQANCIAGTLLFGRDDPRRHAVFLLNNLLGGPCMNSLLNMEMRDRRGLVYTVESNVGLMSDTGLIEIYFGCDPSAVKRCMTIIGNQIDRLAQSPLPERRFAKIRDQYCGQLIVSGEHRESRAMALAKSLMYYGEIHDLKYTEERIREVTAEEVRRAAELIMNRGLSLLTLA